MNKIVEQFVSIQGEGSLQGQNMLFIRWFGCNLKCPWCDEPKHVKQGLITERTDEELVQGAVDARVKWVCLTGGEISIIDMNPLIEKFQAAGIKVQVESNGYKPHNIDAADVMTCSPKDEHGNIPFVIAGDWTDIKLVVQAGDDAELHIKGYSEVCENLFVQPMNHEETINDNNLQYALYLINKYPHVGLSIQLHKILGVD